MSSVQIRQDPDSCIWEVDDAAIGVHWSFITEADARDAAGTLEVLRGTNVLLPLPGMDLEAQAGAIG